MNLDFEASAGMSREEAGVMNEQCIQRAENKFPSLKIWGTMPREHFLLYLDRYGKNAFTGKQALDSEQENLLCRA